MHKNQYQADTNVITPNANTDIEKLIIQCRESGLTRIPEIASALEFLLLDPGDSQLLEFVQEALADYLGQEIIDPDPYRATNPIDPNEVSGQIKLGFIEHSNIKYGINPDELVTNMLAVGRTGGGKTRLALLLLSQILELRK